MKVRDIMTESPTCITRAETLQNAAMKMRDENVGALPVVGDHVNKEFIGMVTDRDIAVRAVAEGKACDTTIAGIMTRDNLVTAHADDDVNDVMKAMGTHQVRRVPVLDEHNRIIGIVAQADIATKVDKDRKTGDIVQEISKPGGQHQQ